MGRELTICVWLVPPCRRRCIFKFCFREDGQGQWSSDGVQIGGRGSAMGVIGMWTSAEHELADPLGALRLRISLCLPNLTPFRFVCCCLGPFWCWKVGPPDVYPTLGGHLHAPSWIGGTAGLSASGPGPSHGAGGWGSDDGV